MMSYFDNIKHPSVRCCSYYINLFLLVFKSVKEACAKHPNVSVLVNFASLRSAYDVTMETMRNDECKNIRTIAIIAEGIPENMTRRLLRVAKEKEVTIIGKIHWKFCKCKFLWLSYKF